MPGGDGTGPLGRGSMTGWGRGFCAGAPSQGVGYPGGGRGFGRGGRVGGRGWRIRGAGFAAPGWRGWRSAASTPAGVARSESTDEQTWLEQRLARLEADREDLIARLEELEARSGNGGRE
jgi:hypothetical protein